MSIMEWLTKDQIENLVGESVLSDNLYSIIFGGNFQGSD